MPRNHKGPELKTRSFEGEADFREIQKIVGFHIRMAHVALYRHFLENYGHLELTQKQVTALWLIGDHPGIAQTDLARWMRMDRATTMAMVNRLQSRKYLVRGRSASDGRKRTLNLTAAGRRALVAAKAAIFEHERWVKARFTSSEVSTLVALLTRIHE